MSVITHQELSAENKIQLEEILRHGNTLLRHWSKKLLGSGRRPAFQRLLVRGEVLSLCQGDEAEELSRDIPAMQAVFEQESGVQYGYTKMVVRLAQRMAKSPHGTMLEEDDFEQEGRLALRAAMFGYCMEGVKFSTYAYRVVKRAMRKAIRRANPFSKVGDAFLLLQQYNDVVMRGTSEPRTFDQVVEIMGLSQSQRAVLVRVMVQQVSASVVVGESKLKDYSELGDVQRQDEPVMEKMLERANLDEFERACIVAASQEGTHGWQAAVAREHTNPMTGKPYSRMAVKGVLERAYKKLLRAA